MKNTAPAEAARTVHQRDLRERRLGRGQLLVPYKMLYKSPVWADVHRFILFLESRMVKTKTLKVLVKRHLLLSLPQHRTSGFFSFLPPSSSTYLLLLYFSCQCVERHRYWTYFPL